jgi:hypothetical protein
LDTRFEIWLAISGEKRRILQIGVVAFSHILDSHIMSGVAPGREPESGGFADVDKADSASGRLISSLRRSPSAFVGARESCGPRDASVRAGQVSVLGGESVFRG